MNKIFKPFIALFRLIYRIIDKLIVTPVSRLIYKINEISKENSGRFEKILNRPNVLIYLSLIFAVVLFLLVDSQVINLTENNAEILRDQKVNVIYNEEAYVIEGVPQTVDITLIGSKSTIYIATQLGDHEVELDLSKYGVGTYKVDLKYNHSVTNVDYKLDPTTVTVKISEKVSQTKTLHYDLLNEDKLDSKLSISNVVLDTNEVVVKSSQEILDKVAVVKALVDASLIDLKESGEATLENVALVAYDAQGQKVDNIEIVPSKVSVKVTIDSYHATKAVKVITSGEMNNGKAIGSAISSVKEVEVYGDKDVVDKINYIEAPVSINNLESDKTFAVTLTKPSGVRYLSETSTQVSVTVDEARQRTITGVPVLHTNLGENLSPGAIQEDKFIDVIITGVESVINDDEVVKGITATVDLSNLKVGTHTVPVTVTSQSELVAVQPVKTEITVVISQKRS
ncbi:MAG: hypothetical protein J1F35_06940 [Erysipelotrichales bacterium]|nr:hypothetical protein [Erysipelotrichales bacterium]